MTAFLCLFKQFNFAPARKIQLQFNSTPNSSLFQKHVGQYIGVALVGLLHGAGIDIGGGADLCMAQALRDKHNEKQISLAVPVIMLVLLAANAVVIQGIALDQIKVNQLDKAEAETIVEYIQAYEADSGQTIDTSSWHSDGSYTWTHPAITYTFMDMNVRAGVRSWSLIDCINYYAGRRFRSVSMPDEIWAANFQGQNWDSFVPEEQI